MVIKLRKLSLLFLLIGTSLLVYSTSARAATCSITEAMTLDQTYVNANTCDTINISGTFTLTISGTIDLVGAGSLNVTSGTVTFSGPLVLGATDDFSVSLGATVTHVQGDVAGVQITARNVTIDGAINTVAKGCQGGTSAAKNGYGPHLGTGVCTISTSGFGIPDRGGASHAGNGGAGDTTGTNTQATRYGDATAPTLLGSGASGGPNSGENGGYGGGRIYINSSGTLAISGTVSANGDNSASASNGSGGGAGGSVYLKASTLSGAGSVSANGGNGYVRGGGGGGGRVAVYYDSSTFTFSNITAAYGAKGSYAGVNRDGTNGSTFILDRLTDDGLGTLTITSGLDFVSGKDYVRNNIVAYNGALLKCDSFATLNLGASAMVDFRGVNFSCNTVDAVNFSANTWLTSNTNTISFAKAGAQVDWDIASNLTLNNLTYTGGVGGTSSANGGILSFNNSITVSLVNTDLNTSVNWDGVGNITLDVDSSINATGKGCQGGTSVSPYHGYGPHVDTGVCAVSTSGYGIANRGGAAHAGAGGRSHHVVNPQATTYGTQNTPTLFGSGGAASPNAGEIGGNGGGKVYINSTGTLSIAGSIASNGATGNTVSFGAGGGSGGSVYLVGTAFSGNGSLSANGGNAGNSGGGGGGGRIAVHYGSQSGTLFSNFTVTGGLKDDAFTSSTSGSIGTTATIQLPVLDSLVITDTSGYTNSATPVMTLSKSGATPTHVAFSCNGGSNWSDWIAYPDDDVVNDGDGPAFNMTSDATGCSATNELKTISAKIKDGSSESSTVSDTTTFDNVAPTVTNVTSTNANGTYGVGDVITITVQFTENPTVSGTPQIELDMVATDKQADHVSTSTDTLTFTYTIVGGDSATDLDYTGTGALTLNSGTIVDVAGNSATLTLPSPGGAGSLGSNKNIMIVTGGPSSVTGTVAILSPNGGETLTAGTPTVIDWTWTSGTDSARTQLYYSLDGGTTYTLFKDYYNGSSSEYTWTVPTTATSNALIKITRSESTYAVSDTSNQVFAIVVASTSETTEPSTPTETTDTPTPVLTDAQLQDDGTFLVPTESRSPFTGEIELVTQGLVVGDVIVAPSYDTVYYLDPKGTRRPFMNAQTYFTYYNSFETIKTVSDATLAVFDLEAPMLPNAGVVLVKIQSDPKVYMINEDGLFRWIANEDVAINLYGKDWSDYVIDMPVTMWGHVAFGEDVYSSEDLTVDTERLKKRTQLYAK